MTGFILLLIFVLAGLLQWALYTQGRGHWFDYNAASAIGALVGGSELLSRYKDSPRRLFAMPSSWAYMLGNAAVSAFALMLVRSFGWTFGSAGGTQARLVQVLVAGTTAMLLLRSSLAVVQVNDKPVPAGPALIVTSILDSIERVIDRNQARYRSADVHTIMQGISFELAATGLVGHVILLLENPTPESAAQLGRQAGDIRSEEGVSDQTKAYNLGLVLLKYAGAEVLRSAVTTLRQEIAHADPSTEARRPVPGHVPKEPGTRR